MIFPIALGWAIGLISFYVPYFITQNPLLSFAIALVVFPILCYLGVLIQDRLSHDK